MRNIANRIINILGIDLADKDTLGYIGEDLLSLKEDKVVDFVKYVRAKHNDSSLSYKKPYQKFIVLLDAFKKECVQINPTQEMAIYNFTLRLYEKLTWYFDALSWHNPTKKQLITQDWKGYKNDKGGDFFTAKEIELCGYIGDTVTLFQLSTRNKSVLRDKIETKVKELVLLKNTRLLINNTNLNNNRLENAS